MSSSESEVSSSIPKHLLSSINLSSTSIDGDSGGLNEHDCPRTPDTPHHLHHHTPVIIDQREPSPCPSCTNPHWSICIKCGRVSAPIVLFSVLSLVFLALGRSYLNQLLSWLEELPLAYSLLVFVLLFTIISFPFGFGYIILNMTAGYLYGLARGQVVVTLAVAIGFSVAFLSCRSCLREWASQYISTTPALLAITKVVEGPHGLKVIFLTRLTPFPFGLQNAMFAVSYANDRVSVMHIQCNLSLYDEHHWY